MGIAVLDIDLGKNVCSVVGLDEAGAVVLRRRTRRDNLVALVGKLPACVVAMEACCWAHHLGRLFAAHGHDVRLMSPEYVGPYVTAQKNDDRDAEGIAEAATRPTMRFVELKSEAQFDMQTLHRSCDRLVGERTALIRRDVSTELAYRGACLSSRACSCFDEINYVFNTHVLMDVDPRVVERALDELRGLRQLEKRDGIELAAKPSDPQAVRLASADDSIVTGSTPPPTPVGGGQWVPYMFPISEDITCARCWGFRETWLAPETREARPKIYASN